MDGGLPDSALTAILVAAGYAAGSLPFGYWLVRALEGDDIRRHGSGNIGASNVWRAYGWRRGVPVMLMDLGKGFAPAFLGALLVGDGAGVLAGGAAMLGHWRPVFMGFARGGKMVATAGGTFLGVAPVVGLAAAGLWIVLFLGLRYASVASMLSAAALPVLAWVLGEPWPVIALGVGAAGAVAVLHRANIRRLAAGTENRFRLRRRPATAR
jgi:glycerol-3-phosphate acyltransferase PlsY